MDISGINQADFLAGVSTEGHAQQITVISRECPYCRERTEDNERGNCSRCERARDDIKPEDIPGLIFYPNDLADVLNQIEREDLISFDTETNSLNFITGSLHGLSLGLNSQEWYLHGPALQTALPLLSTLSHRTDKTWLAYNAPFDLHFLHKHGFDPHNLIDVMVAAFLVDENQEMKLKYQSELRLNRLNLTEFKDLQKGIAQDRRLRSRNMVEINDIPLSTLVPYAALDARLTYDLWPILKAQLIGEGLLDRLINVEMPYIRVLERMERRGVRVDLPFLAELTQEYTAQRDELAERWDSMTGGVNPNSHPQLGEYLLGTLGLKTKQLTPTGQPKLDELNLKRMAERDKSGAVKLLLDLRSVDKIISVYLNNLQTLAVDGRIHTNYNRCGARTGRLASSGPNLQNIPIRTELGQKVRRAFIPSEGMVMLVIDYSQVELRLAAHYSKDPSLLDVFLRDGDPHQMTADRVGVDRRTAKTLNFLIFYGGGPDALSDEIEIITGSRPKRTQARAWLDGWWIAYPGAKKWSDAVVRFAHNNNYVPTLGGRKRRLPDIESYNEQIMRLAERQAVNSPIQGSAADILEDAMIDVDPLARWFGGHMVLQVHDELVLEVPEEHLQHVSQQVQEIMEGVGVHYNLRVPLRADPGSGPSWGDAKH